MCLSDKYNSKYKAPDRFNLDDGNIYQIVKCINCGFVYLNPRPKVDSIAEFYKAGEYQPYLSTQKSLKLGDQIYDWIRSYSVRVKRNKIENHKSKGKLLDIGCGTGEFLNEMQNNGWEVEGIEQDPQAAAFAKNEYRLKISTDEISEKYYLEKSFDVITFWHVLEHLYNPMKILKIARELLKDDGLILIAVPNVTSFDAQFYQNEWVALDSPRHLHHFIPESLQRLCSTVGLEIPEFQQMTLDAFYNCMMSERMIITQHPIKRYLLPLYLFRAFVVALITIIKSSRKRTQNYRQGSSILYFIHKQ